MGGCGAITHQGNPLLDANIAGTLESGEEDSMKIDAALLPGGYEWIIILVVVLIFFGPKKLLNSPGGSERAYESSGRHPMKW